MNQHWFPLAAAILLAGAAATLLASPAVAGEPILASPKARAPKQVRERPPGVPTDAELTASGARVGAIHIDSRQLFDRAAQDEHTRLGNLANRLHIQTRQSTIEDQLLFKSGDVYDPRLVAESARILRSTRYLRDAWITPVAWHDGVVDIEVTAQDVWTFNPGLSFGRKGGKNTSGFEIEELNLLGTGAEVGIGFKSGVDRDSRTILYRDRMLGSSWWSLATGYSDNSDGRLAQFALDHPFYALDVRRAGGVFLSDDRRTDSRYDLGKVIDEFETREKFATIYYGISNGIDAGWTRRWSVGATYEDHAFDTSPGGVAPLLLPADRRLVYPWIAGEWIQDAYHTDRNREQIEKTEDYSLGWRARAQVGYASEGFGSDRNAVTFSGTASRGIELSPGSSLIFDAALRGRVESGELAGTVLEANARYFMRQTPRRLFFMQLGAAEGQHLDAEQQILLGGDNGLRGYPLRYQAGTGRWLFTAEQRWFTNWYPFQLFNVGGAVFYDMGATWGRDPLGSKSQGLLKDLGFGLRLGNSRSALGNVLHIDVAFPLDGDTSIHNVQFLVETKRTF